MLEDICFCNLNFTGNSEFLLNRATLALERRHLKSACSVAGAVLRQILEEGMVNTVAPPHTTVDACYSREMRGSGTRASLVQGSSAGQSWLPRPSIGLLETLPHGRCSLMVASVQFCFHFPFISLTPPKHLSHSSLHLSLFPGKPNQHWR